MKNLNKVHYGLLASLFLLFFTSTFTPLNVPIDPLTIVTDESWEVSKEQTTFNEYPLSIEALNQAHLSLKGGSMAAVVAKYYEKSTLVAGTKPIWRTQKATNDWESFQFKKVFMLRNNLINTATFKINCDDAARVYVNGQLIGTDQFNGTLQTGFWQSITLKNLSAYFYNRSFQYDVKPFLKAGALNTILIEAVSEPVKNGHAYVSARLDVDFIQNTVAIQKPVNQSVKPIIKPKKTIEKVVISPKKEVPQTPPPTVKPIENEPQKPIIAETKTTVDLDAAKIKVGDVFELKNIYFKADDYQLNSASQETLIALAAFLTKNKAVKIEIGGHTNLIPTSEYALKLSSDRAQAVVNFLKQNNVAQSQLTFKGYGKTKPKLMEKTAEANQKNQRVEMIILAK
jgi:outer membrane protein OmpA-like peptidoglycan-associated protein